MTNQPLTTPMINSKEIASQEQLGFEATMNSKLPPMNSKKTSMNSKKEIDPLIKLVKSIPSIKVYEMEKAIKVPSLTIAHAISGKRAFPKKHNINKKANIEKYLNKLINERIDEIDIISKFIDDMNKLK